MDAFSKGWIWGDAAVLRNRVHNYCRVAEISDWLAWLKKSSGNLCNATVFRTCKENKKFSGRIENIDFPARCLWRAKKRNRILSPSCTSQKNGFWLQKAVPFFPPLVGQHNYPCSHTHSARVLMQFTKKLPSTHFISQLWVSQVADPILLPVGQRNWTWQRLTKSASLCLWAGGNNSTVIERKLKL